MLTLVTNPIGTAASKMFAAFQKCEIVFKREDIAIIDIEAGTGGAKVNHAGDLTSLLVAGDVIYIYSEGVNYTYNGVFEILAIVAGEITLNTPYIESATGGYANYLKNYFVELQCVNSTLSDVNLLPFSLESDGDAAGNITFDVSIVGELLTQRGEISQGVISNSENEFEIKYREVYDGSANGFTLVDSKLFIIMFAIDTPTEDTILNQLDEPILVLGYEGAIVVAKKAMGAGSSVEMPYNELDINKEVITSGTLGQLSAEVNGFYIWKWLKTASVNSSTKYIEFNFKVNGIYDFATPDFAYPDFLTQ